VHQYVVEEITLPASGMQLHVHEHYALQDL
jgi:hypothetical protein